MKTIANVALVGFLVTTSCASANAEREGQTRPLPGQLDRAADDFFRALEAHGMEAQSCFTVFVCDGSVHRRYAAEFRRSMELSVRRAAAAHGFVLNTSADRIFFVSDVKPAGWADPPGAERGSAALASEVHRGTPAGWTILNAFWTQYNRLLIGDANWIGQLPDSVRADLAQPLQYVLRVSLSVDSSPSPALYIHSLNLEMLSVGDERQLASRTYKLELSYVLQ